MAKVKPYGFSVSVDTEEHQCLFSGRDWGVLQSDPSFSHTPKFFQSLMGFNALGQAIGIKKYRVVIPRNQLYFVGQLGQLVREYEKEREELDFDYKIVEVGGAKHPLRSVFCHFMGLSGQAIGGPGKCTLDLRDEKFMPTAYIDLRKFKEFATDDKVLRVRKKARGSEIGPTLQSLHKFVQKFPRDAVLSVNLVGGDT